MSMNLVHSFLTQTASKYSVFVPITSIIFALFKAAKIYGSYIDPSLLSRVILEKKTLYPLSVKLE